MKIDDRIEMVVVTCDLLCARAVLSHFYSQCLYSAVRNLRLEKYFYVDSGTQLVLCDFKVVFVLFAAVTVSVIDLCSKSLPRITRSR